MSNYTKQQIEEILDTKVNWVAVHKDFCFPVHGYHTQIHIFADGRSCEMASNNYYQEEPEDLIGTISAEGIENLDSDVYLEGWTKYDEESNKYKDLHTGESLSFDDAVTRAIEDGEWDEGIQIWKDKIIEDFEFNSEV